jgi:hypothetical protein
MTSQTYLGYGVHTLLRTSKSAHACVASGEIKIQKLQTTLLLCTTTNGVSLFHNRRSFAKTFLHYGKLCKKLSTVATHVDHVGVNIYANCILSTT